jgi:prepilin-type N-terminal cleavage/methylation domain-containing protein
MNARGDKRGRRSLRPGMTLVEVIVAVTLLAIIGISLTRLMSSQMRFADTQIAMKDAREVGRSSLNALTSDIRMVDVDSGIVAATSSSFTVLAPYAAGVVCGAAAGGGSVITLLPYDSASYAEGGYAGYAYIDTTTSGTNYSQLYQYVYTGTTPTAIDSTTASTTAPCKTATDKYGVFKVGAVAVVPAIPTRSIGQAAFLFRKVTYAFKPSVSIPGSIGIFRTVLNGAHGDEELVAPFSSSAQFQYLLNNGTTVTSATGSNLNKIRGIQLQLTGVSEHVVPGATQIQSAPILTTIFFKNRPRL